jgi:hypothetical protein
MMAIAFPSNASLAFSLIIDLANLKIIPVDFIVETVIGIKATATQESMGYSDNLIESMGLVFIGLVLLILGVMVCYAIYKFAHKKFPIVDRVMVFLANKILFNTFIRTFIASYLVFAIASFNNVKHLNFSITGLAASSVIAIFLSIIVVMTPVSIMVFIIAYFNKLNSPRI